MKRKIAAGIVRLRVGILIALLICAAFCVPAIGKTRINYDLTRYLDENTMTKRALKVMEEEFGTSEQLYAMFQNLPQDVLNGFIQDMNGLQEV